MPIFMHYLQQLRLVNLEPPGDVHADIVALHCVDNGCNIVKSAVGLVGPLLFPYCINRQKLPFLSVPSFTTLSFSLWRHPQMGGTDTRLQWLVKGCCMTSVAVHDSHVQAQINSVFTSFSVFFLRLETRDLFGVSIVLPFPG